MSKFIKWELINFFKKNYKFGIAVLVMFIIALIIPHSYNYQQMTSLFWLPF